MFTTDQIQQLRDWINRSDRVLLIGHEKPDGDAISSLLAMRWLVQKVSQAKADVVCRDNVPAAFVFLPEVNYIQQDFLGGDYDLIITLDCGDMKRTGFADRILSLKKTGIKLINVDHHPKNDVFKYADLNLSNPALASTTQIIYQLCQLLLVKPDVNMATWLFAGLYTDTGSFQHIVTSTDVLHTAAELLSLGAQTKQLSQNLSGAKTPGQLKLWGRVISRVKINKDGLVVAVVTQQDLAETGTEESEAAGLLTVLESLDQCKVAVLLCETNDGMIKGSLRSNNSQVDVSKLARFLGGGGHIKAAGFTIPGKIVIDKHRISVV